MSLRSGSEQPELPREDLETSLAAWKRLAAEHPAVANEAR
jgi:hypothetical protein